jgi:hypothetical protein
MGRTTWSPRVPLDPLFLPENQLFITREGAGRGRGRPPHNSALLALIGWARFQ